MASFFEKLKKGMGIEQPFEQDFKEEMGIRTETPAEKKITIKRARKTRAKVTLKEINTGKTIQKIELKAEPMEESTDKEPPLSEEPSEPATETFKPVAAAEEITPPEPKIEEPSFSALGNKIMENKEKEKWSNLAPDQVGQLAIDVYQTENDLVIQSAIAGVKPETLDVIMEKDIIAIKGAREKPFEETGDYFSQECYWGSFSREVILPAEVDPNKVMAELKDGILTIRIPKLQKEKRRKIVVRGN